MKYRIEDPSAVGAIDVLVRVKIYVKTAWSLCRSQLSDRRHALDRRIMEPALQPSKCVAYDLLLGHRCASWHRGELWICE
jgi:hypothetical protein